MQIKSRESESKFESSNSPKQTSLNDLTAKKFTVRSIPLSDPEQYSLIGYTLKNNIMKKFIVLLVKKMNSKETEKEFIRTVC